MNDLTPAIVQKQLTPMLPDLTQAIPPTLRANLPAERIMRTIMVSVEKTYGLGRCSMQSIVNAAWSAAVLGLEVDGITGQAYLIPFAGKAQLVIGYKGYNTLAARSGYTVNSAVVRSGDKFDFQLGTGGFVKHKPNLDSSGDIIAAWAVAEHNSRPPIIQVLSRKQLDAVKAASPGAKKSDSPWNDPRVGFEAMCEKTAKRRLARSMPLNVMQLAAALDSQADAGHYSYIDPAKQALVSEGEDLPIEGEFEEPEEPAIDISPTPEFRIITAKDDLVFTEKLEWLRTLNKVIDNATTTERINKFLDLNLDYLKSLCPEYETEVNQILFRAKKAKETLSV